MLLEKNRSQLTVALKDKKEIEKNILRLILGEISTLEARNTKINDAEVKKIIRRVMESNTQTMSYMNVESDDYKKLIEENGILNKLLPERLEKDKIRGYLGLSSSNIVNDVIAAKSDGVATGLVVKFFKQTPLDVSGEDISEVVREMRKN